MSLPIRNVVVSLTLLMACAARGAEPARSVREWVRDLGSPNVLVREEALEVLAQMGPAAREAADDVRPLLKDTHDTVRLRAAVALWKIEGQAEPVLPALQAGLRDRNLNSRLLAIDTLLQMGPQAKLPVPALVELLAEPAGPVAVYARQTLTRLAPRALPELGKALGHENPTVRRDLLVILAKAGPDAKETAPAIRERLRDTEPTVRLAAAQALWAVAREAEPSFPVLLELLQGPNTTLRLQVLQALAPLAPKPRTLTPVLLEVLKESNPQVRVQAAAILWDSEQRLKETLPVLTAALKDRSNFFATQMAKTTLESMGPVAKEVVPALLEAVREAGVNNPQPGIYVGQIVPKLGPDAITPLAAALRDDSPQVRTTVITALGTLGEKAAPHLAAALPKADGPDRLLIVNVLGRMGPEGGAGAAALAEVLKSDDRTLVQAAINSLGLLAHRAGPGVLALLDLMRDPKKAQFQPVVGIALGRIGPAARPALPGLLAIVQDEKASDALRLNAARALGGIGPRAREAVPVLERLMPSSKPHVAVRFAEAWWQIDPLDEKVAARVGDMLDSKDPQVAIYRGQIVDLLGRMGPSSKPAVPQLVADLKKLAPSAARSHIIAIGRIGPEARDAAPRLKEMLALPDKIYRVEMVSALLAIGAGDATLVPILKEELVRTNLTQRNEVLAALARLGPEAREARDALVQAWRSLGGDVTTQFKVAEVLAVVDPSASPEVGNWLRSQLAVPGGYSVRAAGILLRRNARDEEAWAVVRRELRDKASGNKRDAAEALGALGPAARDALPDLKLALESSDPLGRVAAALAVWKIDHAQGEQAVPVLVEVARMPTLTWPMAALEALGAMGRDARPALPALGQVYRERSAELRPFLLDAVRKIDPAGLPKLTAP
jgi:HEAT repeat protein